MTEQLPYSRQEEQLNVLTHSMGVLFAVYVLWDLISQSNVISATVSAIVYGASLLVLFLASTLYHASTKERIRAIYKKCDHCAIYLLIAGTYTPYLVISLSGAWSIAALVFIWSLALGGVAYKLLVKNTNKKVSLATYLLMGWFALALVYPLYLNLDLSALWWLLAGGIAYSLGTVFYSAKTRHYSHAIWHVFVLVGCVCHYLSISLYVY
ncbi:PAQR family membrane homeostasis protein TrhA [Pseudoalteromonas sp. SYSU M81236]|jgi:hemolysin III|uniref:PAQR family membrane homeostasis protein TrhA n=1 Tax=unclassified Pseudoalteromonas TaxID=194690 RepID=UPI001F2B56DC|nr:hemolysin III family protein [Pseudoalteromonas sp. OFAV1]MCF2901906.1 hemolysin III family protein [Pseudoalteromonas sp. OFAV1]